MSEEQFDDAYWQKKLSKPAYHALRHADIEAPNTGQYVHTDIGGWYLCAGCGTPLFSSSDKVEDDSGYATFRGPIEVGCVSSVTNYTPAGEPLNGFTCTKCGGYVGRIDTLQLQSSLDLEQGTVQSLYHASSHAVVFKKALSPRNYPVAALLLLFALVLVGYGVWSWGATLTNGLYFGRTNATVPLWVGDTEVSATVVHLDKPNASTSGMVIRQDAVLLLVLDTTGGVPAIRFANHAVDILWLDTAFKVVGWEHERASQAPTPLDRPRTAQYALIAQPGAISTQAFATGFEIIVTDKTALF